MPWSHFCPPHNTIISTYVRTSRRVAIPRLIASCQPPRAMPARGALSDLCTGAVARG
jgi:hypothetical protein